jgi:hypothetical protein
MFVIADYLNTYILSVQTAVATAAKALAHEQNKNSQLVRVSKT